MSRRLMICTVLLCLSAQPSNAQFGIGEIVFDPTNFTKNEITAAQMLLQVANSSKEVELMLQNLVPVTGAWYPYARYVHLIREVMDTINRGEPLHYYLPDLNARQLDLYRGYEQKTKALGWPANYELLTHTALNVQRGMLNTVHEELSLEDDIRVEEVLGDLRRKATGAFGNKDLAQLNNYYNELRVTEARRLRHMIGALSNAIIIKQQHDVNLDAWTHNATDTFLVRAKFPARAYTGAGGIRTISIQ